jgi:hypothetical protein
MEVFSHSWSTERILDYNLIFSNIVRNEAITVQVCWTLLMFQARHSNLFCTVKRRGHWWKRLDICEGWDYTYQRSAVLYFDHHLVFIMNTASCYETVIRLWDEKYVEQSVHHEHALKAGWKISSLGAKLNSVGACLKLGDEIERV